MKKYYFLLLIVVLLSACQSYSVSETTYNKIYFKLDDQYLFFDGHVRSIKSGKIEGYRLLNIPGNYGYYKYTVNNVSIKKPVIFGSDAKCAAYDNIHNILYVYVDAAFLDKTNRLKNGIYKLNLNQSTIKPKFLPGTERSFCPKISPHKDKLFYFTSYNPTILDLKTMKHWPIENVQGPDYEWLTNNLILSTNNQKELISININNQKITYFNLKGYATIAVSPDGKKILLSNQKKIDLYNIKNKTIKTLVKANGWNTLGNYMIWFPDQSGFFYLTQNNTATLWALDEMYDVKFYSFAAQNTLFDLGGFSWFYNVVFLPKKIALRISMKWGKY